MIKIPYRYLDVCHHSQDARFIVVPEAAGKTDYTGFRAFFRFSSTEMYSRLVKMSIAVPIIDHQYVVVSCSRYSITNNGARGLSFS
jgi:hypothetical protein